VAWTNSRDSIPIQVADISIVVEIRCFHIQVQRHHGDVGVLWQAPALNKFFAGVYRTEQRGPSKVPRM
jgi:hypothetical protein